MKVIDLIGFLKDLISDNEKMGKFREIIADIKELINDVKDIVKLLRKETDFS